MLCFKAKMKGFKMVDFHHWSLVFIYFIINLANVRSSLLFVLSEFTPNKLRITNKQKPKLTYKTEQEAKKWQLHFVTSSKKSKNPKI